jgi:hypothetical protein
MFMDDWLMFFVDVLLNNHWLMMLMNHILMMFVDNIFLVFNIYILVMLMNYILMDFFDNWLSDVSLYFSVKFMLLYIHTFISFLELGFFLMLHHDWFLVDFLHHGLTLELRRPTVGLRSSLDVSSCHILTFSMELSSMYRISSDFLMASSQCCTRLEDDVFLMFVYVLVSHIACVCISL